MNGFERLRQDLPITRELAYFQTGSYGPTPESVLQVVHDAMTYQSHSGAASPETHRVLAEQEQGVRQQLAAFLNVRAEELAWTPNTSQAMQRVLHAVHWQPGDEIVVSTAEHVSTVGACQALAAWHGVAVKTIPADQGDDALLEALPAALTERTRLVCLSQVSTDDGRRLPVAEAAAIAHEWQVPVVVDGAQSVGQYPVDVGALGCDFFVASGHKWLLGPMGLGFLWIASDRIRDFRPDFIPDVHPWLQAVVPPPPITAATRVELGTHEHAIPIGLGRALEIMTDLGLDHIEAHVRGLIRLLIDEIGQWGGVRVLSPAEPGHGSGLVALAFDGSDETRLRELIARLLEQRIVVKYQPTLPAMRISIACFNTEDEVHHLLEVLRGLISGVRTHGG